MAAADYFLKVEGIEGESLDSKHKNEIQISSWSWGASNSGSHGMGGGGGAGKSNLQDATFVSRADKSMPKLQLACWNGDHLKKAVLTCRKAGKDQQEYLLYTFTDLIVSSSSVGGSDGDSVLPMHSFSFNFAKVEVSYKAQKADGTLDSAIQAGWDVEQNKKI